MYISRGKNPSSLIKTMNDTSSGSLYNVQLLNIFNSIVRIFTKGKYKTNK